MSRKAGVPSDAQRAFRRAAVFEAAKNGQLHACERALEEPKIKVDQRDSDGATSLMHSASRGYLDIVKLLVDKGARVNAKDDLGETAIMKACKEGQLEVVEYFIQENDSQKKKSGKTRTCF